jgi:hypothetical protein
MNKESYNINRNSLRGITYTYHFTVIPFTITAVLVVAIELEELDFV